MRCGSRRQLRSGLNYKRFRLLDKNRKFISTKNAIHYTDAADFAGAEPTQQAIYYLNTINLNAQSSWYTDQLGVGIPLPVVNVTQLEKDTLLVCLESKEFILHMIT